jgi:hypothetical protein
MDDVVAYGTLFLITVPLWLPVVAAAYAVGRRQFSLRFLFVVITAEALSLGGVGFLLWWMMQHFWDDFKR